VLREDVYLVVTLYEDISVKSQRPIPISSLMGNKTGAATPQMDSVQQNSGMNGRASPRLQISHGRRGVAAGVADISRLFRMEESVESPFTVRMYTTYFEAKDPSNDNR